MTTRKIPKSIPKAPETKVQVGYWCSITEKGRPYSWFAKQIPEKLIDKTLISAYPVFYELDTNAI